MNITKDLGSLFSGLFASQAPSSVPRLEQGDSSRSRTTTRQQPGKRETTRTAQGSDRLTLSSESLSLASSSQAQAASSSATSTAHSPAQPSELLALPYSPLATNSPQQQSAEESPSTRQLVRKAYGSSESLNTSGTFDTPTRIDFHA